MAKSMRYCKNKGKRLQNEIAQEISKLLNIPVEKDGDIESRPASQSGVDVILRGDAKKKFPYDIECKNAESWSVHKWIVQARKNKKKDSDWLLFCRRNYMDPIVIMDAETFFNLYKKYLDKGVE